MCGSTRTRAPRRRRRVASSRWTSAPVGCSAGAGARGGAMVDGITYATVITPGPSGPAVTSPSPPRPSGLTNRSPQVDVGARFIGGRLVSCVVAVLRNTSVVLIATLPFCSCATVVSTVISPISGPVDVFIQLGENRTGVVETCVVAVAAPLLSLLSPFAGFMCGLREDYDGSYVWSRILRPWWNLPSH